MNLWCGESRHPGVEVEMTASSRSPVRPQAARSRRVPGVTTSTRVVTSRSADRDEPAPSMLRKRRTIHYPANTARTVRPSGSSELLVVGDEHAAGVVWCPPSSSPISVRSSPIGGEARRCYRSECRDGPIRRRATHTSPCCRSRRGGRRECALESRIAVATRTHRDVACGAGRSFRVFERRTAPPAFDEQGISSSVNVPSPVVAHQHRVFVLPADIGLGLEVRLNPSATNCARRDVEFAHNTGVAAATRETDEHTGALGLDDVSTAPHPVLVLLRQRERPRRWRTSHFWRVFLVLLKSRAAPDAPCVHRIAPEVVRGARRHARQAWIWVSASYTSAPRRRIASKR